jgi:hypothetical protein
VVAVKDISHYQNTTLPSHHRGMPLQPSNYGLRVDLLYGTPPC